jgi:hypothetical protein
LCYLKYSLLRIRLYFNKPLGFIQDDRILDEKSMRNFFLNSKASDRNTRRNRGRHGRRERWKRRIKENIEHLMLHFMMTGFMIYLLLKI